ncbi:hypothetical protein ISCGN_024040 [Ixodes scapularis]
MGGCTVFYGMSRQLAASYALVSTTARCEVHHRRGTGPRPYLACRHMQGMYTPFAPKLRLESPPSVRARWLLQCFGCACLRDRTCVSKGRKLALKAELLVSA